MDLDLSPIAPRALLPSFITLPSLLHSRQAHCTTPARTGIGDGISSVASSPFHTRGVPQVSRYPMYSSPLPIPFSQTGSHGGGPSPLGLCLPSSSGDISSTPPYLLPGSHRGSQFHADSQALMALDSQHTQSTTIMSAPVKPEVRRILADTGASSTICQSIDGMTERRPCEVGVRTANGGVLRAKQEGTL